MTTCKLNARVCLFIQSQMCVCDIQQLLPFHAVFSTELGIPFNCAFPS